jgi:hypothetical protein
MDTVPRSPADKPATAARIYDYLLGGTHNFPADREVARKAVAELPFLPAGARANRAFLRRAVRHLSAEGVDQFLDIGSGIPTEGNVHEVAQQASPTARVVYVDTDPLAVAESLDILNGNERATAVRGDLRDPRAVLAHPELRRLLDLDRPVGLLLIAVLHFLQDDAVAQGVVAQLMRDLAPGSYLVASHIATESFPPGAGTSTEAGRAYDRQTATGLPKLRNRAEFARFFTGLDVVEPGIVWLPEWRADPGASGEFADQPRASGGWAGVGRKTG